MIRNAADAEYLASKFSSYSGEVAVKFRANFLGYEGLSILGREHDVNQKAGEGLGYGVRMSQTATRMKRPVGTPFTSRPHPALRAGLL